MESLSIAIGIRLPLKKVNTSMTITGYSRWVTPLVTTYAVALQACLHGRIDTSMHCFHPNVIGKKSGLRPPFHASLEFPDLQLPLWTWWPKGEDI